MTQIACDSPIKAPQGCTQYYYGSTTNSAKSYGYNSGNSYHLANQNQKVCVRYMQKLKFCIFSYLVIECNEYISLPYLGENGAIARYVGMLVILISTLVVSTRPMVSSIRVVAMELMAKNQTKIVLSFLLRARLLEH